MSFYDRGLKFSCAYCGKCCRVSDGFVWLSEDDVIALSGLFELDSGSFKSRFTELEDGKVVLKNFPNGDCIFFDETTGCKVYDARPGQCKAFPFWPENVESEAGWEKLSEDCPGANSGEVHLKKEIERRVAEMRGVYPYEDENDENS